MKVNPCFAFSLLILMTGLIAIAKPADPRPKTFVQPDGQSLTVQIRGDERHHYFLSEDGYLLVEKDNAFYYGDVDDSGVMVSSGIMATQVSRRTASARQYLEKVDMPRTMERLQRRAMANTRYAAPATSSFNTGRGLFPDSDFPVTGSPRVLVILVDYADVDFRLSDPYDYFDRLLHEPGFSLYDGTGSVADYFLENSLGQFTPQFDLYGPVSLPRNRVYYGGNDFWGNDEHPEQMIIDACRILDDEVDFSVYDNDGDGVIDNVYVFYAGEGEAGGGGASTVWPHSWNITAAQDFPVYVDGVQLDRYACSNEWESWRPDGIGTFVHEFSHVMGLPDLYATSYTSAFTPGAWSALDYGPYNNDGCTPPAYGAFERYALGWMEPTVLDSPANVTLPYVAENEACIVRTSKTNEFFLFENRQQVGWDTYVPSHGMLVWHIDYNASVWSGNTVNNSSTHQYVDIVEADDSRSEMSRDGDPFPGSKRVTSFTDFTRPAFQAWNGEKLGLPITEIAETDGIISFFVAGGIATIDTPVIDGVTNVGADSFDVSWTLDDGATSYLVNVFTKQGLSIAYVDGWDHTNVGHVDHATVTGLSPAEEYFCTIVACQGSRRTPESQEVSVTTAAPTFDYFTPIATEATDVTDVSFVANWEPLEGAVSYNINVYTITEGEPSVHSCDFTGGLAALPQGWVSTSNYTYATASFSGKATPALRMSNADVSITSPTYDADIKRVSFWHRGSNASSENRLCVLAKVGDDFVEVARFEIVNDLGGMVYEVSDFPIGSRAVCILYDEKKHTGAVAVDDIDVYVGASTTLSPLAGYENVDAGDALSFEITGLEPGGVYAYTVTASDGELTSRVSDQVMVTTLTESGISSLVMPDVVSIVDNTIHISGAPGSDVQVYDMLGRMVRSAHIGADGEARVALPKGMVYIVRYGSLAYRIKL